MKKLIFFIALPVLLVVLAFMLKGFVRDWIVVPVFIAGRVAMGMPQDLPWYLVVGIIVFIAGKSLSSLVSFNFKPAKTKTVKLGKVEEIASLIWKARKGIYYKERLARTLGELAIEALAHREQTEPEIITERLRSGELDIPPDILEYLQAGLIWDFKAFGENISDKEKARSRESILGFDPLKIIEFLEKRVENTSGN